MLDNDWLLTCAPLGIFDSKNQSWKALGAGVFIYDEPFIWYVTANHLIASNSHSSIQILINHAETGHCLIDMQALHKMHKMEWAIDKKNDLAATLFPSDPNFLLKAIKFSSFMHSKDMIPSMVCYSIGCPHSLVGFDIEKIIPCVQDGIISGIDSKQGRVYVTVPTFPGNSGGPLFVWKQPIQSNGNFSLGGSVVYLGGIITQYALVNGENKEKNPTPPPPLHLGIVIPTENIQNLLNSSKSQALKQKIKSKG
jgi:hypothetical protein